MGDAAMVPVEVMVPWQYGWIRRKRRCCQEVRDYSGTRQIPSCRHRASRRIEFCSNHLAPVCRQNSLQFIKSIEAQKVRERRADRACPAFRSAD
jgi:hypothetical protein